MKKHLLPFLLAVLTSMVDTKAFAYDIAIPNTYGMTIYYQWINNNTELAVTGLYDDGGGGYYGDVVIPECVEYAGRIYNVTSISYSAFYGCNKMTSLAIPNGVTYIGMYAFHACSGLTSITIPSSLNTIDEDAFAGCI